MVDFNKRVHNTDKFRGPAIYFKEHGCYIQAPRGTTDYVRYWEQETDRCLHGYTAPDGDSITGYHYFYLNYSPIMRLKEVPYVDREGNQRTRRERVFDFPRFWDYDYYYFNAIEQAEDEGKHMAVLKSRQRGYSFKGASMLVRNYELIPGSKNFAVASEQKFLIGDGLLTKAWQIMDFIDKNTAWAKQRLVSTRMERVAGYKITDEFGKQTEQGYMSSITGITLKNDPERIRGTRGKLVLWEEGGKFPNLLDAWRIEQPSVETDDGKAFGLMVAYGTGGTEGCLTAGNKVYTANGVRKNIEDITIGDGILGYNTKIQKPEINTISHINAPIKKDCVKISTKQYRDLSCSVDHPIFASNHYDYNERRVWEWIDAGDLKPGDLVATSQDLPVFGQQRLFDPYLVGLLVGDGTYGGTSPYLFNADEEILRYVTSKYDCVDSQEPQLTKDGRIFRSIRIRGVIGQLKQIGIQGQTDINKKLPECVFSCTKHDCCEVLAGLFDTDGCARVGNSYGNRLPSTTVVFTTVSLNLAKNVRDLLQKIGVNSAIQKKLQRNRNRKIRGVNPYYNVEITDRNSLINFCSNVSLKVQHKSLALKAICEICKKKKRWHRNDFGYETVLNVENIGEQTVYNLAADDTHTYIANGIITHNSSFTGLKELFYKPEAYNILSFPNIWDDNAENTKCGFFVPSWSNLESFDEGGKYIYMDEDGNSLREKAIENLVTQRNKIKDGGASQQSIDRFISERPIKPQEAILELGKNIFPRKLLMDQLSRIRANTKLQNMKHVVDLSWGGNGEVIATEKKSGDITTYPLKKGDKPHGSVVIWEYPITDAPFGLYIGGCLTPGEKVYTQRGLVNVEDVTLDDRLLNKNSEFVEIKNLQRYEKVNEPIFKIKPYGSFRTTTFTGEHPIWVHNKGFVKAKDLKEGDWLEIPNRRVDKLSESVALDSSFTCDNLELLEEVQDMLFGMRVANSIVRTEQSYRINITKSDQQWIKFEEDKILIKIENIEKSSYTGIVYNFECETHTFMCRNILTHNCDPLNVGGV